MKHERTGSNGKVVLEPGEVWAADQQCMAYCPWSYLADWIPLFEGDEFKNTMKQTVTVSIDYGNDLDPSKDQASPA